MDDAEQARLRALLPPVNDFTDEELLLFYKERKQLKDELAAGVKDKLAKADILINHLKAEIKRRMEERGSDQIKVTGGATSYWKRNMTVAVDDWGLFYQHLADRLEEGEEPASIFAAFQRKVTMEYVAGWAAHHDKAAPPGTTYAIERELMVRVDNKSEPGAN